MLPRNHRLNAERVQCKVKSQNTERYDNLDETGWNADMGVEACGCVSIFVSAPSGIFPTIYSYSYSTGKY